MNRFLLRILVIGGFMLFAVRETAICQDMEKMHEDIMKDFGQVATSSEVAEKENTSADKSDTREDKTCKVSKDKSSENQKSDTAAMSDSASEVKTNH